MAQNELVLPMMCLSASTKRTTGLQGIRWQLRNQWILLRVQGFRVASDWRLQLAASPFTALPTASPYPQQLAVFLR
jgi:hypothetical protein